MFFWTIYMCMCVYVYMYVYVYVCVRQDELYVSKV